MVFHSAFDRLVLKCYGSIKTSQLAEAYIDLWCLYNTPLLPHNHNYHQDHTVWQRAAWHVFNWILVIAFG